MKTLDETITVDDTVENLQICKKYCGSCPTSRAGNLSASPPDALFLRPGKIIRFIRSKNDQLLLSGV
jgi:hypothetical protein